MKIVRSSRENHNPLESWVNRSALVPSPDWVNGPLLGFDLETTGTDPYSCRIVDMAVVYDDPSTGAHTEKSWLVNPEMDIPLEATAVHGISTEVANEKGVPASLAISELYRFLVNQMEEHHLEELPPVCIYNAAFDIPVLMRAGGLCGDWDVLDPFIIDKYVDAYRPGKRTLTATSAAYGLGVHNAHSAIGDVMSTMKLMRAIARKYPLIQRLSLDTIQQITRVAYREQMTQFMEYRNGTDEPDFVCSVEWPCDDEKLSAVMGVAA